MFFRHIVSTMALIALLQFLPALSVGQVVTWTGAGDGFRYSDPTNWNTNQVPINDGSSFFNVIVPDGQNILFDVNGIVSGISFGNNGEINVATGVDFRVSGVANIDSPILADGSNTRFSATGIGVSTGSNVTLNSTNGAKIEVAPSNFEHALPGVVDVVKADGTGSEITLGGTQSIVNSGNGVAIFSAVNSGSLDLSSVTEADGGGSGENRFIAGSGSTLNLDSLTTLNGRNRFTILDTTYALDALQTVNGGSVFDVANGSELSLANLASVSGGSNQFVLGDSASVAATNITRLDNTTITLGENATFNAGSSVNSFQNSSITIGPTTKNSVTLGPLLNIDNSRIAVEGGATFQIGAGSFDRSLAGNSIAFRADGAGSHIDASSLESIQNTSPIPPNFGNPPYITEFIAENNGSLDFSGVRTIDGGAVGSFGRRTENRFIIRNGGSINLNNLESIDQLNRFDIQVAQMNLPALQQAGGVTLNLDVGTLLSTPELLVVQGTNGSSVSMPTFSIWNAGQLQQMHDTTLNLSSGAILNAPSLTTFENSSIDLTPGVNFNTGQLNEIDNSRFRVAGGSQLQLHANSFTRSFAGSSTAMHIEGTGSLIDASGVESIANQSPIPPNFGNPPYVTDFIAENNGTMDFSSVSTIDGGSIGSFGRATLNRFTINSGGKLLLGDVEMSGYNQILIGANGTVETKGLTVGNLSLISATDLGTLRISGDLSYSHTAESYLDLDGGRVEFSGISLAELEVGGENLGTSASGLNNFGFQQLTIGNSSLSTRLVLADRIDNGNRAGGSEAQYLLEVGGTGLSLTSGSELVLNGLDLYYSQIGSNEFTSIRSAFLPGERTIQFDSGFVSLTGEFGEVINGSFDNGLTGFNAGGTGEVLVNESPFDVSNFALQMTAGSPVEVSQFVSTLSEAFFIELDAYSVGVDGSLSLFLNGELLTSWDQAEIDSSAFGRLSFLASDPSLFGLVDVELGLRWNGSAGNSIYIDNWQMVRAVPEPNSLLVLAAMLGASVVRRKRIDFRL